MYVPVTSEPSPDARDTPRGNAREILSDLLRRELLRPGPAAITPLLDEIRRRHGDGIAAIVFYGSCLRTASYETGVLDFYVLVDRYRDVHRSRAAAVANAVLPPTVYYLETPGGAGLLRAKYAVLSCRDYLAGARLDYFQSVVWARFCQPAMIVYARDAAAVATVVQGATESTLTMLTVGAALVSRPGTTTAVGWEELWRSALSATYGAELRVEKADTVRTLYVAAPERYDRVARLAIRALVDRGDLRDGRAHDAGAELHMEPGIQRAIRRRWAIRRAAGKPLAAARLLKSMVTFGEASVRYALGKLERHTGIQLEVTDRQRRWFWIACWPIIARLLIRRTLR